MDPAVFSLGLSEIRVVVTCGEEAMAVLGAPQLPVLSGDTLLSAGSQGPWLMGLSPSHQQGGVSRRRLGKRLSVGIIQGSRDLGGMPGSRSLLNSVLVLYRAVPCQCP